MMPSKVTIIKAFILSLFFNLSLQGISEEERIKLNSLVDGLEKNIAEMKNAVGALATESFSRPRFAAPAIQAALAARDEIVPVRRAPREPMVATHRPASAQRAADQTTSAITSFVEDNYGLLKNAEADFLAYGRAGAQPDRKCLEKNCYYSIESDGVLANDPPLCKGTNDEHKYLREILPNGASWENILTAIRAKTKSLRR